MSLKVVLFESLGTVSYSPSIVTVAVFVAVSEIFSVKACDLEIWVRGRPRSLEMVPFDRLYTSSYCCGFLEYYNFTRGQWFETVKFSLRRCFSLQFLFRCDSDSTCGKQQGLFKMKKYRK